MRFYAIFPKLLNMSLTASVAIVVVMLLRLVLKRTPKVISYALWAVVLFRLLCPVSLPSDFSLFGLIDAPTTERTPLTTGISYVPEDVVYMEYPAAALPVPGGGDRIPDTLPTGQEQPTAEPREVPAAPAAWVWLAGVLVMAAYSLVSYGRLRRKLLTASPLRENIYLADGIPSPFVLGLLRPKIYLPSALEERERVYIIRHEQHHIRRGDHIIKALAFLALSLHWFNPLVWVAFLCSNKDMEMSCDEAVVKELGDGILADYTASLLSLATGKRIIAGMPLAFGEGDTKGRIRNLARWKKPAVWVIAIAVVLCLAAAVCLLTNPQRDPGELPTAEQAYLALVSKGEEFDVGLKGHSRDSVIACWGEPDGMLSGFWGDIWKLEGLGEVIVYYDEGGHVEHVKADQAEAASEQTVTWTYAPMLSATGNTAFSFRFNATGASHLVASCDNGTLWNPAAEEQPREKALRFERGEPLCWLPTEGDSPAEPAETAQVTFTLYDGEVLVAAGALVIQRTGTEGGRSFYEARLTDGALLALRQEEDSPEVSVEMGTVAAYTDLNRNRVNERVILRADIPGEAYTLSVVEGGEVLWSTGAGLPHTGWNTVLLYYGEGQDYLAEYTPAMNQGYGSYTCTLFSLEGGRKTVKEEWSVDFALGPDGSVEETAEMAEFAERVDLLLRSSAVLLSTQEGILVEQYTTAPELPQLYPVYFDPAERQRTMELAADPTAPQALTAAAAAFPTEAVEFVFASGVGAWGTSLTLEPDGSFTGDYGDSDWDRRYVCTFAGRFTDIRQVSDCCWAMRLEELTTEEEEGTTWMEGDILHVASEPYGVAGGREFLLYAPGTPADLVPAACRDWWPEAYAWRIGEIDCLDGWCLCNLEEGTAFYTGWIS